MSSQPRTFTPDRPRREFAIFIIFGLVNLVLTYAIYLFLRVFLTYPVAYSGSYACGIVISYVLNARYVFKERLQLTKALQYPLVYLAQYLLGLMVLYVLVELAHLSSSVAPLAVPVVTVPATFLLSRYLIKGRPRRAGR